MRKDKKNSRTGEGRGSFKKWKQHRAQIKDKTSIRRSTKAPKPQSSNIYKIKLNKNKKER